MCENAGKIDCQVCKSIQMSGWGRVGPELSTDAVVTCKIKLLQNCSSLRRRPSEMILREFYYYLLFFVLTATIFNVW